MQRIVGVYIAPARIA